MKNYTVPRDWVGETVVIVASGPSVAEFKFSRIKGLKAIAVKDGYLKVPNAEVLMIGDHRYARRNPDLSAYKGPLILYTDPEPLPEELHDERIQFIPKVAGRGLSTNPAELRGTFTTTALAINLAVLRGAKRILLVGVDAQTGEGGKRWFGRDTVEHWPKRYQRQRWGYTRLSDALKHAGVTVLNLNPNSAVDTFPRVRKW